MNKFNITSSFLNSQYEYENDNFRIQGSMAQETDGKSLVSISGSVFWNNEEQKGRNLGNFNGRNCNGEMIYTLPELGRKDSNKLWDAIDDIEGYIKGENQE